MLHTLKTMVSVTDKALEKLVTYLMVLLVTTILLQVVYRFIVIKFIQFDFSFTDEVSRYTLIWITYFAIGLSYRDGMHVSVDLLADRISAKNQLILSIIIQSLMMMFNCIVIFKGIPLAIRVSNFTTPTLEISQAWVQIAPVVGCILLSMHIILQMVQSIFTLLNQGNKKLEGC